MTAPTDRPGLDLAAGPREAEERVLERIGAQVARDRDDPSRWSLPLRVVVPSRSLRLHLGRRIVTRFGAVCGLSIQTLTGLAHEVVERAGRRAAGGDAAFELLARRVAAEEPLLAEELAGRRDGLRSAVATLRDFLDAGFLPAHADALVERLAAQPSTVRRGTERALALVRAAARLPGELDRVGRRPTSGVLARAAEILERAGADAARVLPARRVLVHGFADATGVATDLLLALLRAVPTDVVLDLPPDPLAPERAEPGAAAFLARVRERLEARAGPARGASHPESGALAPPRRAFFRAPGAEAEAREVARRVWALLDGGTAPEDVGVVARDLRPHRAALRAAFLRHGVPFSGLRARGPGDATTRRIGALSELLRTGGALSVERWLDALVRFRVEEEPPSPESSPGSSPGPPRASSPWRRPSFDLRLAFRSVGVGRLDEAAALDPATGLDDAGDFPLPVRGGLRVREDEGEEAAGPRTIAVRRRLPGAIWRGAVGAAGRLGERLRAQATERTWGGCVRWLGELVREDLGARAGDPLLERLGLVLEELADALPADEPARLDELALAVERAAAPDAAPLLGGAGGGVLVLDATEARGRTFEHLFLIGVGRDRFPRVAGQDPLLPDDLRRAALDVLPDLAVKGRSRDEERHLFAQLVAAAPDVTVSWESTGDDGETRSASPLVERWLGPRIAEVETVGTGLGAPAEPDAPAGAPRPPAEHACLAALAGGPSALGPALRHALSPEAAASDAATLAALRAATLEEYDRRDPGRLGPWLGMVGPCERSPALADPLREPPFVTTLERLVACPWQTFLTKLLRLAPAPDPLEALPSLSPLRIGSTVHETLQRVVERALPERAATVRDVVERVPVALAWPPEDELTAILHAAAARVLEEDLQPLPGLIQALAAVARPHVEAARRFFERAVEGGFVGVELRGEARVSRGEDEPWRVAFRADAVERRGGRLVLSDYKTGKPLNTAKTPSKRREKFLAEIRHGRALQAAAYAAAHGVDEPRGRLLFLPKDPAEEVAEFALDSGETAPLEAFAATVRTALEAWREGAFLPRLLDPKKTERENQRCASCEVALACVRGDSGIRGRLAAWGRGAREGALDGPAAALWRLACVRTRDAGAAEEDDG